MRRLFVLVVFCFFFLSVSAFAQPNYLIRIDRIDQLTIDKIKSSEIEVYTKSVDFWIAGADEKDLQVLTEVGVVFQILDVEADVGEFYLVYSKPKETIQPQISKIKEKARVLAFEQDMAVVKGNPKKIEKLALLGFDLRKINKRPLPLESETYIPSYLESLSLVYDPLIAGIVDSVEQDQLLSWIDDLSGEDTVLIGAMEDSIKSRYSYSDGVNKAAHWLKERFEDMGVPAEFDTFKMSGFSGYFINVAASPGGQKAWAVSNYGGIVKTINGGDAWDLVSGTDVYYLWRIQRVTDDILWAVGDYAVILRSTDGGDTWEDKTIDTLDYYNFRGCYFENQDTGWVGGDDRIIYTEDGGTSWTLQKTNILRIYAIDFVDQNEGWAVGNNGTVLHTNNRGANWDSQTSGSSASLRDVQFLSSTTGWTVGTSGVVLYTIDSGANWNSKDVGVSGTYNGLCFADASHGWIVGYNPSNYDGYILYSSDGGNNWSQQSTNAILLYGVDFSDTQTGWACGYREILKTSNQGQTWFSQYGNLESLELLNVVAMIEGFSYPGREFLITGHYDAITYTDPYNYTPGADDNASGVVSLLASASILKDYYLTNTVKFVAFPGEEQGLFGSAAYAEEAYNRGDSILGVLNFDMIAYDGNGDDRIELHCGYPSENQALADLLIEVINDYSLDLTTQKITSGATDRSDHASFWDYNFPAILGIEDFDDFNPYYHEDGDRVSVFDTAYYVDFTKAAVAGISILADPFLIGDANGDGMINLADAIWIANYYLKSGAAPEPLLSGDVDCDDDVNLADAIYIANYYLKSGDPPCSR